MMENENTPITFCYDKVEKKVGCALLQAAYGATIDNYDLLRFETKNWLLSPTDNLEFYRVENMEQLDSIIEMTIKANTDNG